jgi:hypothetical protein
MSNRKSENLMAWISVCIGLGLWVAFAGGCYTLFSGQGDLHEFKIAMTNFLFAWMQTAFVLRHLDNLNGFHVTEREKLVYSR